jgi:hypothetical protein
MLRENKKIIVSSVDPVILKRAFESGLQDGIFLYQKYQYRLIWEGLVVMANIVIFYDHMEYFTAILYIYGHLVILWSCGILFPIFWYILPKKSGNPI